MSILDNNPPSQLTLAQSAANDLIEQTKNTFNTMVNSFNNGANNFWSNPVVSPSAIANCLGSDAAEVFRLHYALGSLINQIKPESIQYGLSKIGQFTINEDGTVTIANSNAQ